MKMVLKKLRNFFTGQLLYRKELNHVSSLLYGLDPFKVRLALTKFNLFSIIGQFNTPKNLPRDVKSIIAQDYAYSEWSRIAIDVATQYPGGDYFEFGSEGLNTLCNFISAFNLNGHDLTKPEVKFFAFDVFGDPAPDKSLGDVERVYFDVYNKGPKYFDEMKLKLESYGLMEGRVELIKGYFKDTLNDEFKNRLKLENRKVGFAFLDCNIPSSYATVFEFLIDFVKDDRFFIYLDEYFQIPGVAKLFDEFSNLVYSRYGLKARYVRTAGSYGALFVFIQ